MKINGNRKYFEGAIYPSRFNGDFEIIKYTESKKVLIRFIDTGYEYWTSVTRIVNGDVKDRSIIIPLFGVGINDADYVVETGIAGQKYTCPFYRVWRNMLGRCYNNPEQNPTYVDCFVVTDWHRFSTFKSWMQTQDWEGKELDKDLLVEGNKEYGPNTCLFVTRKVNLFTIGKSNSRGELPQGVTLNDYGRYIAQGYKPDGKYGYLGSFSTVKQAHDAWKQSKKVRATVLAAEQTCERTAEAILKRFA